MSWELEHHKNLSEIPAIVFVANKLQEIHDLSFIWGARQTEHLLVAVGQLDALVHTGCPFHWWTLGDCNRAILASSSGYSKGFLPITS